ncbi:MAG: FAD-binding protein [Candidatus Rokubacteria bacterium]|nr:FAD-binding protein [Candidatus Rokubacteria bacterium]
MHDPVSTDVLVIGGGAAGAKAALTAHEAGARVTMVVKGFLGKSGCSIFASHLPYYDESTQEKASDRLRYAVRYYNHYLTDQDHVRRMGVYMRTEFHAELERLGVYWLRDEQDRIFATGPRVPTVVVHKQGASGPIIMEKRRREIFARGIPVLEECAATALLTDGGRVVGATIFDYRHGVTFPVAAKTTILATGHSDYLASRSTATREQSADGVAMALRAGAEAANLEMQWWHVSDMAHPRTWMRIHVYPNPLLGTPESSRLYNTRGDVFYEQKTHSPGSSAPYVEQARRLALEVQKGLARWDGGYFSGYDHIPADVVRTYQHQAKVWQKLGLDVGRDRLECGITWHMRQGGLNVDAATMRASLPGLYLAGGIGCHYLGGVGPVSYDGKVAGTCAADEAHGRPAPALPSEQVEAEDRRIFGFLRHADDGCLPIQLKLGIRDVMWELGYVKNERKLVHALQRLQRLRDEELPRMGLQSTSRTWNSGWLDALDVTAMLDATEATVRSALLRKESRGPFYRDDYPVTDNEHWIARVVLWRNGNGWQSRIDPIPTPHLKPEKAREPFFEADY